MINKRGQVTIFVIVAIVIVVALLSIFFFRDIVETDQIPTSIEPIKTRFMSCLEGDLLSGIQVLGAQGGYIDLPEFEAGSRYQPTSSQLTFNGIEVPYWFYMNGANIPKENVPTIESMERNLESFVQSRVSTCMMTDFEDEGYVIEMGEPEASVKIESDYVSIDLEMDIAVEKNLDSVVMSKHELRVDSNLGLLYDEALNVYNKQNTEYFLEEYAIDVLRLNLPVDGVELGCSPLIWSADSLYYQLKDALQDNIMMITNKGESNNYFVVDLPENVDTDFFYSSDWPTYFEVNPTDDALMVAKPVGNQAGLGVLGFCYVPYHYVYNVRFPVLVRLTREGETFQFPMNVLIEGNVPRESLAAESISVPDVELCERANTDVRVNVFNTDGDRVDGQVSFECFGSKCQIGESEDGRLDGVFPQCVNGLIKVKANGYKETSVVYSTVDSGSVTLYLDAEYQRKLALTFGENPYSGKAVISFVSDDYSKTVVYPEQREVVLSPGIYDVSVYAYASSSITIPESEQEICAKVPRQGVLGIAGFTKEECTTVVIPEQIVSDALVGGGRSEISISDDDLRGSVGMMIMGEELKTPKTLEELQENYVLVESNEVGVEFR